MKPLIPTIIATSLALLASCGPGQGRDISEFRNASTGDSLMYYYTQMRAYEYWREADNDTAMRSPEQRSRFLDGLKAGMDAIKKGHEDANYNRGVRLGVRMAANFLEFERLYGVELDDNVIMESFKNGLQDNQDIPELEYQEKFYALLDRIKARTREKDREKSQLTLIGEARDHHLAKLAQNLYFRIEKKGSGPYAHTGDAVYVNINFHKAHGEDLGIPSPEMVTIGAPGVPDVLNRAYTRLNKGSVGIFATTAESVFASRTEIMGLNPSDVIIMAITMNDIMSSLEELPQGEPDSI